jgi:hypothetical protein
LADILAGCTATYPKVTLCHQKSKIAQNISHTLFVRDQPPDDEDYDDDDDDDEGGDDDDEEGEDDDEDDDAASSSSSSRPKVSKQLSKLSRSKQKQAARTFNGTKYFTSKADFVRLTQCLIVHREDFLQRERALSVSELDSKSRNWFWVKVADSFNDAGNKEIGELSGSLNEIDRWTQAGLSPVHTGFFCTPTKAEEEFKDKRTVIMKQLANYRTSGNGDGSLVSPRHLFAPVVHAT